MTHEHNLICKTITDAVLSGNVDEVINLINRLQRMGMTCDQILSEFLTPAITAISENYCGCDYSIPQMILFSRAAKAGLDHLKPPLQKTNNPKTIVLGTVKGDLHCIGKDLVSLFFQNASFKVIDLGVDVSASPFMDAVKQYKPDLLGMSVLLTSSMEEMTNVINLLNKNNLRHTVKILVGGSPVTKSFADSIGADAFGPNAHTAPKIAFSLINKKSKSFLTRI